MTLSGKQRRFLRAEGHHKDAVVQVGKEGLTDAVVASLDQALATHELVKIKLGQGFAGDRHEAAETLAGRTKAELVQVLGGTILLYRPDPDEPKLELPRA